MSVGLNRSSCHAFRVALVIASLFALVGATGCAADSSGRGSVRVPDEQSLAPATQALDTAVKANAEQFAPRSMDAARRRITLARDILFSAARENRAVTDDEQGRVDTLVKAARLDAKEALTETQAKAIQTQLDRLHGNDTSNDAGADNGPAPEDDGTALDSGLGLDDSGLGDEDSSDDQGN